MCTQCGKTACALQFVPFVPCDRGNDKFHEEFAAAVLESGDTWHQSLFGAKCGGSNVASPRQDRSLVKASKHRTRRAQSFCDNASLLRWHCWSRAFKVRRFLRLCATHSNLKRRLMPLARAGSRISELRCRRSNGTPVRTSIEHALAVYYKFIETVMSCARGPMTAQALLKLRVCAKMTPRPSAGTAGVSQIILTATSADESAPGLESERPIHLRPSLFASSSFSVK